MSSWVVQRSRVAIVSLMVGALVLGAASPVSAQQAPEKLYCDGVANFCGLLYYPSSPVDVAKGGSVSIAGVAETLTLEGNGNIRARVNYGRQNGLFFKTNGTSDSGTVFRSEVRAVVRWQCTPGDVYKLYSDHWGNGTQSPRLEGTLFIGCRERAQAGPIEI